MKPVFNLEKMLIFWRLRDIIVTEDVVVKHMKGYDARKIVLDNGKKHLSVVYIKTFIKEDVYEYELLMTQIQEPDDRWGTSITTQVGDAGIQEIDAI